MRHAALLFGAGLLAGAAATFLVRGERPHPVTVAVPLTGGTDSVAARQGASIDFLELVAGSLDVTEQAALYRFAAQTDRAALQSLTTQVAALPKLASRSVALEVLLTRYAELDAPAAAALARDLDLEAAVAAPLFAAWARRDSNAALRALGAFDAATAMTFGVAMLEALGNDDLGIVRVLGAAPQIDADRFRIEAAVVKARTDPRAAIDDALLLPQSKRSNALAAVATAWTKYDLQGALAYVELIHDTDQRSAFKGAILRQWGIQEPEALLSYVLDMSADEQEEALRNGTLYALSTLDPLRALEVAGSLAGQPALMVRRTALMQLAADDPLGALRHVESLPHGFERQQILQTIASTYGRLDPTAALAWAETQNSPEVLASVLSGVARTDATRAMDLLLTLPLAEQQRALQSLAMMGTLRPEQMAAVADRLRAQPGGTAALRMLTNTWAQRTPEEALRWLLANPDKSTSGSLAQAGMQLARINPAAAMTYLDRIPSELRARWISAVADGYAQNDAPAAASWLTRFRGEPGYEAAVAAVAGRTAQHDPVGAARLFASIDLSQAPDAEQHARAIAMRWARDDIAAAASWARALDDDAIATGAVSAVTSHWAARDAVAARNWTLTLPPGAKRDAALVQIVGATAGTASAEPALLDAFSSTAAQQTGISQALWTVAQRDPDAARHLADDYLTDATARDNAHRAIDQSANGAFFGPPPPRLPQQR